MKKRTQITEKTRQKFIDTFCELYKEKPIEKITVQELIRETGYNRSTFYQYFKDIYDLLDYIEEDVITFIIETRGIDFPTDIHDTKWLNKMVLVFETKKNYLAALLGNYGSNRFTDRLKAELPGVSTLPEPFDKESAEVYFIYEAFYSGVIASFRSWVKYSKYLTSSELVTLISQSFFTGLDSKFGQNMIQSLKDNVNDKNKSAKKSLPE